MSTTRDALRQELDELLDAPLFRDHGPNGLQVEGRAEIGCLATAATASLACCRAAVDAGADALLVHHGLFWGSGPSLAVGMLRQRLGVLIGSDMNLLAYHLPLDAHPRLGNNAVALRRLGLQVDGRFAPISGGELGCWAATERLPIEELLSRCQEAFAHEVLHCPGGPPRLQRIGVITGGGQSFLSLAKEAGLDALVTGEASEQSWHEAAELGIHLLACGHHATECHAVHELGAELALRHGLRHIALPERNPA